MDKISVIIPIYNAEKYLSVTMKCLLEQDYPNYEVIAVNDCSSDASRQILEKYSKEFKDKRLDFTLVNRKINGGLCSAINTGLAYATGDYLCFPDADDEFTTDYLSSMHSVLLNDSKYKWVRCDYTIMLEEEQREYDVLLPEVSVYKDDFYDFISKYIAHNAWNMLVEREYFEKTVGKCIYNSRLTQEWSILLPLSYHSNYARCNRKLYRYHIRKQAMSSWQEQDLHSVINHINGLEELNYTVLSMIKPSDIDRINKATTALSLYYHLFRAKKYIENGAEENASKELYALRSEGDKFVGKELYDLVKHPDLYVRIVFDVLLEGNVDAAISEYKEYKEATKNQYGIIYDKGGAEIQHAVSAIYGKPEFAIEYDERNTIWPVNVPIIGLIQNSKKYSVLCNEVINSGGVCLEYRNVRNSIRGWAYENQ